ncbi:MAG: ABC transporter ATP-binding protein [Saccharofermentanales bacterium]
MIVKMDDIVKRYGTLTALDHFGLEVEEGEVFGLLGPNGSGKTTAINCMLSLLQFEQGRVEIFGSPMTPTSYDIKRQIGIVMQNVAVFPELTVYENINYFCGLYIKDKAERKALVDEAVGFVGLQDFVRFVPKKLSGGLLRRLNIACGIAHKPRLIILDEPTVAVDPQSRNNILEGILELNRRGSTVIYTSHYMEEVEQICSRIAIMDKGRIVATGTNDELKASISIGEKITLDIARLSDDVLEGFRRLPNITSASREGGQLLLKFNRGNSNLKNVLDYLHHDSIEYGRITSELPTLNDVFLEITGKELRD